MTDFIDENEFANAADPVEDARWPNIRAFIPERDCVEFPDKWGAEPTPRDEAAIEAGSLPQLEDDE